MRGSRGEKLLTASDLAALCEVDLKTIHNWVERGRIAHFRTPGRHLRFRAPDVAAFLRTWGYAVPRELAMMTARPALVIGSADAAQHVRRVAGDRLPIEHASHPYDALVLAGAQPTDRYVIDVPDVQPHADPASVIEALRRACPQASIIALVDDATALPSYVTRVSRADATALAAALGLPEAPAAGAEAAEAPAQRAAGSSR